MYALTGITGKVGGELAKNLLAAKQPVRAILRDADKGAAWREKSCEVAIAEINDAAALAAVFTGTDAVFVLLPGIFDPSPGFTEAKATVDCIGGIRGGSALVPLAPFAPA